GGATMLADHADKIGLSFPNVDPGGSDALAALLPEIATVSNPLDYTTPIWGQPEFTYPVFSSAIRAMQADVAVLVQDYPAPGLDNSKTCYQNDAATFTRAAAEQNLPAAICATIPENLDLETRQFLIGQGVAPMQGIHEALNAIRDAATWAATRDRLRVAPPERLAAPCADAELNMLTEEEGKTWLQTIGFPIPKGKIVTAAEAKVAAEEVGYPVALKMMNPQLAHKTEAGAVALNVKSQCDLSTAIAAMTAQVTAYDPTLATDRFLVEAMLSPPLAELIVTLRRDRQFGHALLIGIGGVLVELLGDCVTLLLPAGEDEIARALRSLRLAPLLQGYRGQPAADISQIAASIHQLCAAYLKESDSLAEVEINPLFAYQDRVVAADVLMHRVVGT
ncbi:MAG: CoA-binding protein, partial [Rhodobacteraceae bacterium]|nr:CoA-binding protein [Paracoccaceae bacterium]